MQTKKLISQFSLAKKSARPEEGVATIHVDEVAARIAAFYENIRTVVEWKEEHLMRRAAIIRKLKRKFFEIELNNFSGDNAVAEGLVLELIRGGHFPNDKIPESKISDVTEIIKKYVFILKNNPEKKQGKTGLQFYQWLIEVAACEIEDTLAPAIKEKALIEYMFLLMKEKIKVSPAIYEEKLMRKGDEEIQIYIAVCQALFKLDNPIISYNLIKYRYANWEKADEALLLEVSRDIFLVFQEIEADMANPISNKFYALCEKYDTPYLLMGDILAENDPDKTGQEITDPVVLESKIKNAYKKRVSQLDKKIFRAAVYLTLSIFLTKILSLIIIEWLVDLVTKTQFNLLIIGTDILIPTLLMFLIVISIKKPTDKNFNMVLMETMKITYQKENQESYEIKLSRKKGFVTRVVLALLYVASAIITIGGISYLLYFFNFPPVSIIIDIIFIALILFAGTAIGKRAQELTMEPEKEGVLSFIADIFFLPMQGFGRWISNTWRQYNAFAAFFNALIDMPFTAFIEFLEGWRYFIKERKEEIR